MPQPVERHFTVTGFLSHRGHTALHWHRLGMWLPPGGHIEPNEDPAQAVLREVLEETGITVEIVRTRPAQPYTLPPQLPAPVTIGVYDIDDPGRPHQHIDLIYFTRPAQAAPDAMPALPDDSKAWLWVSEQQLRAGHLLARPDGAGESVVAEDVRVLALEAIAAIRSVEGQPPGPQQSGTGSE